MADIRATLQQYRSIRRERARRKWLVRAKIAANVLPIVGVLVAGVVIIGAWFW